MPTEFEWDPGKAARNLAKHGVRFELMTAMFLDERRVDYPDVRVNYGEERRISIAAIEDRIYLVVYVMRGETCRIISARAANRRERRVHDGKI